MKRHTYIIGILLVVIMLSLNIETLGQRGLRRGTGYSYGPGQGYIYSDIPGLTAKQEQEINRLEIAYWKDMTDLRYHLEEKSIDLNSLTPIDAMKKLMSLKEKLEKRN